MTAGDWWLMGVCLGGAALIVGMSALAAYSIGKAEDRREEEWWRRERRRLRQGRPARP